MDFLIPIEILQRANAYMNDQDPSFVFSDDYRILLNLMTAIQAKTISNLGKEHSQNSRLMKRLERYDSKQKTEISDGTAFVDMDGDYDYIIARSIIYLLKDHNHPSITKSKVICILYLVYAAWLESHKQHITLDRPVWTQWGPQFWKVATFLDDKRNGLNGLREDIVNVGAINGGGLLSCISNTVDKYGHLTAKQLANAMADTRPLQNAAKLGTNTRIKDEDIYYWQQQRKGKA